MEISNEEKEAPYREIEEKLENFNKNGGNVPTEDYQTTLILLAMKLFRGEMREEISEIKKSQKNTNELLRGKKPDGSDGLVYRLMKNEAFRKVTTWIMVIFTGAILTELATHWISNLFN